MRLVRLSFIIAVLALAACAELQQYRQPVTTGDSSCVTGSGVATWLEAVQALRAESPAQQQLALANWEKAFRGNPDIDNRMRLALLLATGEEQVQDRRRARSLLKEIDPLPEAASDREMIALLMQWLDEQAQAGRKLNILWKQVTDQSRRIEELELQLQALTTIEQNIQSREVPAVIDHER